MKYFDFIADFVSPPNTVSQLCRRLAVFMVLSFFVIELGKYLNIPASLGFMFGYAWGGLTVYGSCRAALTAKREETTLTSTVCGEKS